MTLFRARWRQCLRSPDQKDARVMRAPTRGSKTDFVPRRPLSSEPRQLRVASACLIRKLRALDLARSDLPCGAGANRDRKRGVSGKSVSVRVDHGGRSLIKKKQS